MSRGRPVSDLAGMRFGSLVAVELESPNPAKWICICDCGTAASVFARNLRSGNTKSCGCGHDDAYKRRIKDLTGQRFGTLTVIRLHSRRRVRWLCRCDCGTEKAILGLSLNNGMTRSCGKGECRRKGSLTRERTGNEG